jgi:hypothetical protein
VHTGRFRGLDLEDRLCFVCASGVEDEQHFLLDCEEYEASRAQLWLDLKRLVSQGHRADVLADLEREMCRSFERASMPASEQLAVLADGEHRWFGPTDLYQRAMHRILIAISDWLRQREELAAARQRCLAEADA